MNKEQEFQEVSSNIAGIRVFAPKPKQEEERKAQSYTCPQCGGQLAYDLVLSGLACSHCGHQVAIRTRKIGPTAKKQEFTVDTMKIADRGWGKLRTMIHCQQCGAELSYAEGAVATSCPYCASNSVNVSQSEHTLFQPQALVPFKVKPDDLRLYTDQWIKDGWMHPAELKNSARVDRFVPFYIPFWAFSAKIAFDWEAEVAHTVTEQYYDTSSKSWQTRTRIEWRWENGNVQKTYTNYLVSGVDEKRLNPLILGGLIPFDMDALVSFELDYLVGINANAYDVDLNTAWATAKTNLRDEAMQLAIEDASNSQVRNLSIDMSYDNERWSYLFLPVYIAVYLFEGKSFQVMVNGQTGKVFGQKPIAWLKVWLAILGALLPGILLTIIGMTGMAMTVGCIGMIFLILGGTFAFITFKKARSLEELL
jgi:DNA-directed RNA polymerase subunit RPC12/RpoP